MATQTPKMTESDIFDKLYKQGKAALTARSLLYLRAKYRPTRENLEALKNYVPPPDIRQNTITGEWEVDFLRCCKLAEEIYYKQLSVDDRLKELGRMLPHANIKAPRYLGPLNEGE